MIAMIPESPIVFDRPIWLWLLLLVFPALYLSVRSIGGLSRVKAYLTFVFRTFVIVLLTMVLANPSWAKRGEGVTTTIILDVSHSVPRKQSRDAIEYLQQAADARVNVDDQVSVISIAKDAAIERLPDAATIIGISNEPSALDATNLQEGVNTALAIAPDDTANRILLVSDGNETEGIVQEAAELARANGVPIDVLPIEYEHTNEVIFERLVAPAQVRRGQSANVKLVIRSQQATRGMVRLTMNGEPLDLNGPEPGEALLVELDAGPNVFPVTMSMEEPGPQQWAATVTLDDVADVPDNNRAVAVTFVSDEGRVLIIDSGPDESESLIRALNEVNIAVDRTEPEAMFGGLVEMSGYDAIVLANVPRHAIDEQQDRMLHAYTHDLGGGLIMLGGPNSFGAGGWIDSHVSRALPLKLDPPSIQQMPRGALVLIMHSCEMPQGNFWGQKVAESAINALSRLDLVGIIEFGWGGAGAFNGCRWAFELQTVGDKQAALAATKKMQVGDMPSFGPSMQLGLQGLTQQGGRAGQRHVIIISDGDPSPPSQPLLDKYIAARVTVTTVMVGGHGTIGDRRSMKNVADQTGGTFYNVQNPKNLPEIFIKEARLVSRSLIQEGDVYQPVVRSQLPGPIQGFSAVPALDGYVLTAERQGLAQTPIVVPTTEGNDPIFAHWNYGLGKSVAFTGDLRGRWGTRWVSWAQFRAFWEQAVRWAMRPSAPSNLTVMTRTEGDRAIVELEALDADASFLNFLKTRAVVVDPAGVAHPLDLEQTGPGRYRGEFPTSDAGAYLFNINYAGGTVDEPTQGNLQAAVSVPYAREYRSVKHNAALLAHLAEQTGGRVLTWTDPEIVDLFDRTDLEVPRSHRRIWDLLAMIAAGLFVLDVAARRLAIDPKWVRGLFRGAVSRRQATGEATVAAWKKARSQVAHRRGGDEAPPDRSTRFEATEADADIAIEAGRETPEDIRDAAARPQRTAPEPAEGADHDDGDYTSRLLQAKRRARGPEKPREGDGDA